MTRTSHAFRRLNYVFAAIDHGSLRQAARALRVRESSVSRNIVALEQFLDTQLFDRDVHGVRLTEAGRAWIGVVRAYYEGLQDALGEYGRGHRDEKTLRIGLCALMGRAFLARLVDRFSHLHPDVNVAIQDIPRGQCLAAIRRRRLDIIFTHELETGTLCRGETFGHERLFVLLPATHPLAEKPAVTWTDLADMSLLVSVASEGSSQELRLLEHIAAAGGPTIQMCHASEATVFLMVQLGQGATLAGESFARAVTIASTVWKPIQGQNSVSSINAIWLESNPKRALLRLVGAARNLVGATSAQEIPGDAGRAEAAVVSPAALQSAAR